MDPAREPSITQIYRDRGVTFESLIARDPVMQAAVLLARKAARSDAAVLLCGETGTGKTLFAQAIHNASPRAERPFVVANCAGFAESLLESELFGHERGAFTGADRARKGVFEQADGGTLFLDEVAELSLGAQAKLLRVVEYKEFERLGGERTLRCDLRVVFATHQDLAERVAAGAFREDLYYRVREFQIDVPPLRRRRADVLPMAERFLAEHRAAFGRGPTRIDDEAAKLLVAFDWPGNVRRLRAVVRRAAALADGETVTPADLDLAPGPEARGGPPADLDDWRLDVVLRRHVARVLAHAGGNKSEAARILGIARTTLDRKLEEDEAAGRAPLV